MRSGFLPSLLVLTLGAGLAAGQPLPAPPPADDAPAAVASPHPAPSFVDRAVDAVLDQVVGGIGTPEDRFLWVDLEYLQWWTKAGRLPPLVTTGTVASQGRLGSPGTTVLLGGSDFDDNQRSGARFTAGYWLDDTQTVSLQGTAFFLGKRSDNFVVSSATAPVLSRPFFDLNRGREDVVNVALPGLSSGSINVVGEHETWGMDAGLGVNVYWSPTYWLDLVAAFCTVDLMEDVQLKSVSHVRANVAAFPAFARLAAETLEGSDGFEAHNQFFGGQIGAVGGVRSNRWFADFEGKLALGGNHEVITVVGGQLAAGRRGLPTTPQAGDLLALPTNTGNTGRDGFSVVPEIGVRVGYQVTNTMRAYLGYTGLFWSDVVRPGDQIDRVIDVSRVPRFPAPPPATGQARPAVPVQQTDWWAQGLDVGVEFRW
jgi:hypothetical protein